MGAQGNLFDDYIPNGNVRVLEKTATELKNDGIKRAMDHAERETPGWKEMAYNFFVNYARQAKGGFMTADVVEAAKGIVPSIPDDRSWGGIARKVKNRGIIKWVGWSPGTKPEHHGNPRSLYKYTGK